MIEYNVYDKDGGNVKFTANIDCHETAEDSWKKRLALIWALDNGVSISDADFGCSNFYEFKLSNDFLRFVHLSGSEFRFSNLSGFDCTNVDFSDSKFRFSNLSDSDFSNSNFSGCVFRFVDLSDCIFRGSDLSGCIFHCSDLSGCEFRDANLIGAHFDGSNVMQYP